MAVPLSRPPLSRYSTSATVVLVAMVCGVVVRNEENIAPDAPVTCTLPDPLMVFATVVSAFR